MDEVDVVAGPSPCPAHFMRAKRWRDGGLCMIYTLYVGERDGNSKHLLGLFSGWSWTGIQFEDEQGSRGLWSRSVSESGISTELDRM